MLVRPEVNDINVMVDLESICKKLINMRKDIDEKSVWRRVIKSMRRPPYRDVNWEYDDELDLDYACMLDVANKSFNGINKGFFYVDDNEYLDKDGNAFVNPGIISISQGRGADGCVKYRLLYISGHAIDRYCERLLKKPGYELTDDELVDFFMQCNRMATSIRNDSNEVTGNFDRGIFEGYVRPDGHIILKTFLAVHNLKND